MSILVAEGYATLKAKPGKRTVVILRLYRKSVLKQFASADSFFLKPSQNCKPQDKVTPSMSLIMSTDIFLNNKAAGEVSVC